MTRGARNNPTQPNTGGAYASTTVWCEDEFFRFCCATEEPDGIHIFWDIKPLTSVEYPITIEVYRDSNLGEGTNLTKIAGPLYDTWTAVDPAGKTYAGKLRTPTYRVKLLTAYREHTSAPIHLFAALPPKKATLARAIIRRTEMNARHLPAWPGYLLKRKWTGESCTCRDPDTKDVYNSDCPLCFGTGVKVGYWKGYATRTILASSPLGTLPLFDKGLQLGTTTAAVIQAKVSGLPPVTQYDAWVDVEKNYRFYITNVKVDAEFNAVPLVCTLEMRLAESGDVLYSVPIE